MNARPAHLDNLHQKLDAALGQSGLLQEILLLRLTNEVINRFATSESEWQTARELDYRHWRQELRPLLDNLQFMISSADAYAPDSSALESDISRLGAQLRDIEQRLSELSARKSALQTELDARNADSSHLRDEVEWLERLKSLVPFRDALARRLDIQHLRARTNAELLHEQDRQRERGEALVHEIDTRLDAFDALLRENLTLSKQEWEAVRHAVDASVSR
ncbi:hypothetical protein CKO25_19070 [Thiocapsa imhoffii]|uniref:Uncharacterized protein n=1 Tax=Thiocapsa imhoffii TaxID=382777 RepID=A0A9X1BBL0_9GAMM|nr:hypothetical protein [Thiocapsa imhoffii]MBK1646701.1 hypothetical protein [Thiocapsa imhoffii]